MPPRETYQKNAWDGGLQAWDMLMEIKYCGSSTVTNNKQTLLRPDSVPYNGACKCFAREIEVIMRVRVRLCGNACVSRRMRVSWQLCKWFKCYGGKNFKQKICKLYLKSFRTTSACKYNLPYKALPPSRNLRWAKNPVNCWYGAMGFTLLGEVAGVGLRCRWVDRKFHLFGTALGFYMLINRSRGLCSYHEEHIIFVAQQVNHGV